MSSDYDPREEASLTSGFSSTGDDDADEVSNRTGRGYDEQDAGTETGSSSRDTEGAWHQARDDEDEEKGTDRHDDNSSWR